MKIHQCLLIDQYTEESDMNALLNACENYMLERKEAGEIIGEVRTAIRDWRKIAAQLQVPVKMLEPYSKRWYSL